MIFIKFKKFKKTIDKSKTEQYNSKQNLNITKNDYDEDGRNDNLYRELPGGVRQQLIFPMTYPF